MTFSRPQIQTIEAWILSPFVIVLYAVCAVAVLIVLLPLLLIVWVCFMVASRLR